ncbi:MAG: hypothetical protein ACK5CA_10360 [Cyanobacteriota bacterium]|jgi:UDP-N-acetylglucosamine pyrophosphorylase
MLTAKLIGVCSAFLLSATALALPSIPAQAQMTMRFSAPFISDSGYVGSKNKHFITLAVTGFALKSVTVALPPGAGDSFQTKAVDKFGQEIPAKAMVSANGLTLNFNQPIKPDSYVTIQFTNLDMSKIGGRALYRVSAMLEGINGEFPVGSAMIRLKEQS